MMAKKLITCKYCGSEIASNAKACPKCGAKNKKPIFKKWWFYVLAAFIVVGIFGSQSNDTSESKSGPEPSATISSDTNQSEEKIEEELSTPTSTPEPINYEHYNVTELFDVLKSNAMKAQETFKDKKVELEGFLGTIDSKWKYIGLSAGENNYEYLFQEVQCSIKNNEQKEIIMEMSRGDALIVRGTITRIGEVLGYSLDIDSIG